MHVSGNPSASANNFLKLTPEDPKAKAIKEGPKPEIAQKPDHMAGFKPDERQALRKILDTPLPPEKEVLGRCLTENGEIRTYKAETGLQRVDIQNKNAHNEESVRTFHSQESAPAPETPRGRVAALETRKHGAPGPQGHAPAVHTVHYTNGMKQTLAESENGELFWLGLSRNPNP
jgi:hypothetical protein